MGGFSLWHWLVVGIIILLLFGKGRFSEMMGDVAKGIKSFKKGLGEEEREEKPRLPNERAIDQAPVAPPPAQEVPPAPAAESAERRPAPEADRH